MERNALDTDTALIWELFKHVFPEFTHNHIHVYKLLWRIEPLSGEQVIQKSGLSKPTTYKILKELVETGLAKKTPAKPILYYAENPIKAYTQCTQKITKKLLNGKQKIKEILNNSTSLSNEIYLLKLDGGQTKLINKETRQSVLDEYQLREIRKMIDQQIEEAEKKKQKAWMVVGR